MSTVETTGTSRQNGGLPGILGGLIWGIGGLVLTLVGWAGLGAYHASTAPNNPDQYVNQQLEAQMQLVDNVLSNAQFASEPMVEAVLWVFYAGHGVPIQFDLPIERSRYSFWSTGRRFRAPPRRCISPYRRSPWACVG